MFDLHVIDSEVFLKCSAQNVFHLDACSSQDLEENVIASISRPTPAYPLFDLLPLVIGRMTKERGDFVEV